MEMPRKQEKDNPKKPSPNNNNSSSPVSVKDEKILAGALPSLDAFRDSREDCWTAPAYEAYLELLVKEFRSKSYPIEVRGMLDTADKLIKSQQFDYPLHKCFNAAYQAMNGHRPGDELRNLKDQFLIDAHQWKHYSPDGEVGAAQFGVTWDDSHKLLVYCAKLILTKWAEWVDEGKKMNDKVLDGFVLFDKEIGNGGKKFGFKPTHIVRLQISKGSKGVEGHGYPDGLSDNKYPVLNGTLSAASQEVLLPKNVEKRPRPAR